MSFNAIRENKILAKISESTVYEPVKDNINMVIRASMLANFVNIYTNSRNLHNSVYTHDIFRTEFFFTIADQ